LRDSTDEISSVINLKKNHNLKNESSFETEVLNVTEQSISTAFGSGEASCSQIQKSGEEESLQNKSISLLKIQEDSISRSLENLQECYVDSIKTIKKKAWRSIIMDDLQTL
jgi:hypothetical protein